MGRMISVIDQKVLNSTFDCAIFLIQEHRCHPHQIVGEQTLFDPNTKVMFINH